MDVEGPVLGEVLGIGDLVLGEVPGDARVNGVLGLGVVDQVGKKERVSTVLNKIRTICTSG